MLQWIRAALLTPLVIVAACGGGTGEAHRDAATTLDGRVPPEPAQSCTRGADCASGLCEGDLCVAATCTDLLLNGEESDVNCGGRFCPSCGAGRACSSGDDCASHVCNEGRCTAPSCEDGVRNGTETHADCGGECPPCADRLACAVDGDCASRRCEGGLCAVPNCEDGVRNGRETGVDCGGWCGPCADGDACARESDCVSGICRGATCVPRHCVDGELNESETGVDCGGECAPCPAHSGCLTDSDCASGACLARRCAETSCGDGVRNGDESGVDCGGSCERCVDGGACVHARDCASGRCEARRCASCSDGTRTGDETDVDCGGPCSPCDGEAACSTDEDCTSALCRDGHCVADACEGVVTLLPGLNVVARGGYPSVEAARRVRPSCYYDPIAILRARFTASVDGVLEFSIPKPAQESLWIVLAADGCGDTPTEFACEQNDVGPVLTGSFPIARGVTYLLHVGGHLTPDYPRPSIDPITIELRERDARCPVGCGGGALCPPCTAHAFCAADADCTSRLCRSGECSPHGCGDGIRNFAETDVDCGGGECGRCGAGSTCARGSDCESGACVGGTCRAPSCSDAVPNGDESGIDCGGSCPACADHRPCRSASDCVSGACTDGLCGTTPCVSFEGRARDAFGYRGCAVHMPPAALPCPDVTSSGQHASLYWEYGVQHIPLDFEFDFYGQTRTALYVYPPGVVSFQAYRDSQRDSTCAAPAMATLSSVIASAWGPFPAWGSDIAWAIVGQAPRRQLVVRYLAGASSPARAETSIVLHEGTSDIDVCYYGISSGGRYPAVTDDGGWALASIDHAGASTPGMGLVYSCGEPRLVPGLLVRYRHP